MKIVLFILLALFVLLMMVTIHEFGHYIAGKILGFKINEFAIGFGPSLFSHKCKSGEVFSIRLCPLGGYCAFEGEENDSENSGAFLKQKPWKRLIVLFNGAFFNFISAIIFCFIMLVSVGYDIPKVYSVDSVVKINSVVYDSGESGHTIVPFEFKEGDKIVKINGEAISTFLKGTESVTKEQVPSLISIVTKNNSANNGSVTLTINRENESVPSPVVYYTKNTNYSTSPDTLQKGDVILQVNGTKIDFIKDNIFNEMIKEAGNKGDSTVDLLVSRNGSELNLTLNLFESGFANSKGEYSKAIGVSSTAYKFTVGESLARCVPYTFGFSWKVLGALGQIVTGKVGLNEVGGPIYTIGTIANLSQQSWTYFLTLLPLIAANLAIFNWLPFPALDGSKMVFTTLEWIFKKPVVSQKTENLIHSIGFIVLLGLVLIADFYHIIVGLFW